MDVMIKLCWRQLVITMEVDIMASKNISPLLCSVPSHIARPEFNKVLFAVFKRQKLQLLILENWIDTLVQRKQL
ncbi:Hypothetical predicted protein [Octopus vulgaris]|uniref:Uncharacterized protein n=1 Tax=Octopus vulgaris TaxID=6645 RepID=A0AA36AWJ8_OCTVU|nr:Hypothetical predicted protein [Octopus vulgaris]